MRKGVWGLLSILFLFTISVWSEVFVLSRAAPLEVTFLDVGEGDSILIEISSLTRILVDGGPGRKVLERLPRNLFFKKGFDLLVLTHPDQDHMEGLVEVVDKYPVKSIYWTRVKKEGAIYSALLEKVEEEKIEQRIALRGRDFRAGEARVETLFPFEDLSGKKIKVSNAGSVVLRVCFGQTSFLLTGDLPKKEEFKLFEKGRLTSDVLKVAHHGSKTSSSDLFLRTVAPSISVIQTGISDTSHPDPKVLSRLEGLKTRVLRTDEEGNIKILSDGENLVVK